MASLIWRWFTGADTKTETGRKPPPPKWVVVAKTFGMFDAELIIGRLRAEEIPARAWSESAGRAFGITIGKLGTTYVEVPEQYVEAAEAIIATDYSDLMDEDDPADSLQDED